MQMPQWGATTVSPLPTQKTTRKNTSTRPMPGRRGTATPPNSRRPWPIQTIRRAGPDPIPPIPKPWSASAARQLPQTCPRPATHFLCSPSVATIPPPDRRPLLPTPPTRSPGGSITNPPMLPPGNSNACACPNPTTTRIRIMKSATHTPTAARICFQ